MDASRIPAGLPPATRLRAQAEPDPAPSQGVQPPRRVAAAQVAPDAKPAEGGRQAMLLARVHAAPALPQGQPSARGGVLVLAGLLAPDLRRSHKA